MRYIIFKCRKCGHLLYVENTNELSAKLKKLSDLDCTECGEEGYLNWLLVGAENVFPGEEDKNEKG